MGWRGPRLASRKAKVEVVETMGEWLKVKAQDGTVGWMHEHADPARLNRPYQPIAFAIIYFMTSLVPPPMRSRRWSR